MVEEAVRARAAWSAAYDIGLSASMPLRAASACGSAQCCAEGCASRVMSSTPRTRQTSAHHLGCESTRPRNIRPKSAVKKIFDCCTTAKVPASMRCSETKPSMFIAR